MKRRFSVLVEPCPCGRNASYGNCCARWHAGESAPDAECLMRSRYCAYVKGLDDYLLGTWHPSTRPATLANGGDKATRWIGLNVQRHESEGDEALVEFVARYKINGRAGRMHEVSRFLRTDGRWLYVDGVVSD